MSDTAEMMLAGVRGDWRCPPGLHSPSVSPCPPLNWTVMSEEVNKDVSAPPQQEQQDQPVVEPQLDPASACNE